METSYKRSISGMDTEAAWRQRQQDEERRRAEEQALAAKARRREQAARLQNRPGAEMADRALTRAERERELATAFLRRGTQAAQRDDGLLVDGSSSRWTVTTRGGQDPLVSDPQQGTWPTSEELGILGSDIPGGGPQLLWTGENPAVVGTITDRARQHGLLTDEQLDANATLANQTINGDTTRHLSREEFIALARDAGIPLERLDPQQAAQATNYINRATDAQNQRDRITWSLSNLQLAADERLPVLTRNDQIELLWAAASVPRHALEGLSDRDLAAAFDRIALATNTPGSSEVRVGRHTLHLEVNADGTIGRSETKPPGFWSQVGGFIKSAGTWLASTALDVIRGTAAPITNFILHEDQRIENTKTFAELSPQQRSLLGSGGEALWGELSALQRGGFLLLTQRMDRLGIDYSGLTIRGGSAGIEQAKLHMDGPAWALRRFQASLEAAIAAGRFTSERPAGIFHAGENAAGGRENRGTLALQIGVGPAGAFVDIDRYNPASGFGNLLLHNVVEVFGGSNPPNPFDAADELGEDLGHRS